jgi:hypothetical protein
MQLLLIVVMLSTSWDLLPKLHVQVTYVTAEVSENSSPGGVMHPLRLQAVK